jgi:hypothetical protein
MGISLEVCEALSSAGCTSESPELSMDSREIEDSMLPSSETTSSERSCTSSVTSTTGPEEEVTSASWLLGISRKRVCSVL